MCYSEQKSKFQLFTKPSSLVVRLQAGFQIISQPCVSGGCVFIIYQNINIGVPAI
jgi:hypothetical protein